MKLEWGKKIACPACVLPFYDLRKTSLVCPNCGNSFEASEIKYKKISTVAMDEVDLDDKIAAIPGFEFSDEVDPAELTDNSSELGDDSDIDDIKLTKVEP